MEQRRQKPTSLQQLWFNRAEKILKQVAHMMQIVEFVEYATIATDRLLN